MAGTFIPFLEVNLFLTVDLFWNGGLIYHFASRYKPSQSSPEHEFAEPFSGQASRDTYDRIDTEDAPGSISTMIQSGVSTFRKHGGTFSEVPVWQRGVSVLLLERFAKESATGGLSTQEVCETLIRPPTEPAKCSAWQALRLSSSPEVPSLIGTSTCFVSHAWQYNFLDLVSIIRTFAYQVGDALAARYFLDIFCMNQHDLAELDSAAMGKMMNVDLHAILLENLTKAITSPGRLLLALHPFLKPLPLTRAWCLYEVYTAYTAGCETFMSFSVQAEDQFFADLQSNETMLDENISATKVQGAEASNEDDLRMILRKIEQSVGVDEFNALIREKMKQSLRMIAMRKWLRMAQRRRRQTS
jgi:hypothetical protein